MGAVGKAWDEVSASFDRFCLAAGIDALGAMMEKDAEEACGARHARGEERRGHRWGRTQGKLGFHAGKVTVERPRVRDLSGQELSLPSWDRAVAEDWLGKWAMNLMLINVSGRQRKGRDRTPAGDADDPDRIFGRRRSGRRWLHCGPGPPGREYHRFHQPGRGNSGQMAGGSHRELLPLGSRMRVRLALERTGPEELQEYVVHALQKAGAVKLMTPELIATLCDHAQSNPRALMNIAGELLSVAAEREARQIDEKLFLETC
jgi:hypothetical protein